MPTAEGADAAAEQRRRFRLSAIAHADMAIMNPLSDAILDTVVGELRVPTGARVLDLGCGKGTALRRVVEAHAADGVGVELSPVLADEARRAAVDARRGRITIVEADARDYRGNAPFDVVMSLGPGWPHTFATLLALLRSHVQPGGLLLVADGYWRDEPTAEYLALLGATRDEMGSHRDNLYAGEDSGLVSVWSATASEADWDRYEMHYLATVERWAAAHPDDPDKDDFLAMARASRNRYLHGGREQLGFAIYLFRVPG